MKKRILSAFLAICLVVTLLPTLALASETTLSDMPSDYSTAALKAAVSNGLLKGSDGKILPNDPLTRAQMAAIIVRAFGATEEALLTGYTDVSSAAWYYKDLGKAVKMKVLQGDGVRLNPEDTISRQQAFAVLARALKLKDGTSADLSGFSDKSSVASWAVGTTAAMVNAGFIQGSNGKLNPTANISRKDFAVMMNNIFKTYVNSTNAVTELAAGTVLINVPGTSLKDVTVKGDLIIGDGVGNGDVTLDNVIVTGRMIVRGGGVNSIIIRGNSSVGEVVISKVDGNVRIAVEGGANVEIVYINDGKDDVIVEGSVDKLVIDAPSVPVTIKGGTVGEVSVNSNNATVMVDKTATVTSMTASGSEPTLTVQGTVKTLTATAGATGATIEVAKGGAVDTVNAGAPDTAISGEGSVKNANVTGNNVSVDTKGTEVKVSEGVTGTTAGGNDVKPGETANTGTGTTGGSPGGGGGGGSSYTVSDAKADLVGLIDQAVNDFISIPEAGIFFNNSTKEIIIIIEDKNASIIELENTGLIEALAGVKEVRGYTLIDKREFYQGNKRESENTIKGWIVDDVVAKLVLDENSTLGDIIGKSLEINVAGSVKNVNFTDKYIVKFFDGKGYIENVIEEGIAGTPVEGVNVTLEANNEFKVKVDAEAENKTLRNLYNSFNNQGLFADVENKEALVVKSYKLDGATETREIVYDAEGKRVTTKAQIESWISEDLQEIAITNGGSTKLGELDMKEIKVNVAYLVNGKLITEEYTFTFSNLAPRG